MAVQAAEAKLQQERAAIADETKTDLYNQMQGLFNLEVQILELSGQMNVRKL